MLFNSWEFAVFGLVVFALYAVLAHEWQNWMLLVASYAFYGAWDWRFLFLLTASALIDYVVGLAIDGTRDRRRQRMFLAVSISANLSILGFFKYYNFFADSLRSLLVAIGVPVGLPALSIVLPLGISFYSFQSMSYGIDVYRGELKATRNLRDYLLFVSFFPHLVAGPIMRATNLLAQVVTPRRITFKGISDGAFLIFWGLFLKVFVADNLARIANPVFASPGPYDGATVLLAVYAFAFQIYGDFAGYSTIARGLGKCFGFELTENFRLPYVSTNPSEFWQRWHISLSTWLRDYLYVPLGGNRGGTLRTFRNLALTMLLGGLWHGAAWRFVVWGGYQGALLIAYRAARRRAEPERAPAATGTLGWWLQVVVFFQLVCVGWVFFRAPTVGQALQMLAAVPLHFRLVAPYGTQLLVKILVPLFIVEAVQLVGRDTLAPLRLRPAPRALMYVTCFYLLMVYGAYASKEFIYFQF
jgi:D-alanyl-lipoteichoic acid acyltransferase DltB (MBOAT superfamily)